jgi:hypothetical protein
LPQSNDHHRFDQAALSDGTQRGLVSLLTLRNLLVALFGIDLGPPFSAGLMGIRQRI